MNPDSDVGAVGRLESVGPRLTNKAGRSIARVIGESDGSDQLEADLKLFGIALIAGNLLVPSPSC